MQRQITTITLFIFTSVFLSQGAYAQWQNTHIAGAGDATGPVRSMAYNGNTLFVGCDAALYRTSDNGDNWAIQMYGLSNFDANVIITKDSTVYIGDMWNFLRHSSDNGVTWQYANLPYQVVALAYIGDIIFAGTTKNNVFHSSDNGAHWDSTALPENPQLFSLLAIGNTLFAGTSKGLFRTTDNGVNWIAAGLSNTYVNFLTVAGGDLYAVSDNGVFRKTNNDTNWIATGSGLPQFINCMVSFNNNVFVGTDSGVFLTTNNGVSWSAMNDSLTETAVITSLAVGGGYIFAGTDRITFNGNASNDVGYIYRRPLSDFGISAVNEDPSVLPSRFSLSQNYPNPFNGATNVEYRIPNDGFVTLKIYDALGEEVATLVNGKQTAGVHNVNFNASDMENGMYFYRLTAGKFTQSGKMAVVK